MVPHIVVPILDKLRVPKNPGPLTGETIWYRDLGRKQLHRELIRDGMERARLSGKRVGRPRVSDELGFTDRFDEALKRIATGELSRRKAARSYRSVTRLSNGSWTAVISTSRATSLESNTGGFDWHFPWATTRP